jgi:hypothetical protein
MKSEKTKQVIYWILTGIVALVFLSSAAGKLSANEEALKMGDSFGLNTKNFTMLGIVELLSVILFIIPRTEIVGTMLLAAYMGGAIASHLEHGFSIVAPGIVQTIMLLVAFYRFPELSSKLLNTKS